jgi:hypothetical protein
MILQGANCIPSPLNGLRSNTEAFEAVTVAGDNGAGSRTLPNGTASVSEGQAA